MNTELWIGKAIESVRKLEDGTVFVLKDLFEGVEWKSLPVGERTTFGRHFKNKVVERAIADVYLNGKAQNNSTRYIIQKGRDKL